MQEKDLSDLNLLWKPLRPYLMRQIEELYGRTDGNILEVGPFSGLIFAFAQQQVGDSFTVAAFPENAAALVNREASSLDVTASVAVVSSDPSLKDIANDSADLVIFRGALFFPSLFRTDFAAIHRVLRSNGLAFVGGGFGKYTPYPLIRQIGEHSRELNVTIGKVNVEPEDVRTTLTELGLGSKAEVITEGGLWIVIRK